jgi:hypothetical protein
MRVERELQVRLSTGELEQIRTVGDMLDLLVAKRTAPTSAGDAKGTG